MPCINVNLQEFKWLNAQTDLDEVSLAAEVGAWMDLNTQDRFPTLHELGIESNGKSAPIVPRKGLEEFFNSSPELKEIGTHGEYERYLDGVFPETAINDLVYHQTSNKNKFESFRTSKLGATYFSFANIPTGGIFKRLVNDRVVTAIVDVKNPFIVGRNNAKEIVKKIGLTTQNITKLKENFDLSENDAVLGFPNEGKDTGQLDNFPSIEFKEGEKKDLIELAVFDPTQIHILGSNKDIEGFKEWVGTTRDLQDLTPIVPVTKDETIITQLENLLTSIGVTINPITDRLGPKLNVADTLNKIVTVVYDSNAVENLSEEASHMFVELIQQTNPKLYNILANDIVRLEIYKEVKANYLERYNGDLSKVKKEAIGQAISHYIVNGASSPELPRLVSWVDKAISWLKSVLSKAGIKNIGDYNNYFRITAADILKGEFKGELKSSDTGSLFKIGDTPLAKLDEISSQITLENTTSPEGDIVQKYFYAGKQILKRVSDIVKSGKNKLGEVDKTAEQKLRDSRNSFWGTQGHEDLNAAMDIVTGKLSADQYTPKTSQEIFNKLFKLAKNLHAQFPGAEVRTEVKIYDPKRNLAGTIDVLIVDTDGKVHLFDYKFIEYLSNGLKSYRIKDWNTQLGEYQSILKDAYGFKEFGQARILPIEAVYEGKLADKVLKAVAVGNNKLQEVGRDYLNPVPTKLEKTGVDKIDELIAHLEQNLAKLESKKGGTDAERADSAYRIDKVRTAIARLKISQEVVNVEELAEMDLARMQTLVEGENLTDAEYNELEALREYYNTFISSGYATSKDGTAVESLVAISAYAQNESKAIEAKIRAHLNTKDINTDIPIKPPSKWRRLLSLSDYDIPAFQALYRLISDAFGKVDIKAHRLYDEIKEIQDQIVKENGTLEAGYNLLLQKGKDGKYIPKLLAMKASSWYENHKEKFQDPKKKKELEKFFDKEGYNKLWEERQRVLKSYMANSSIEQYKKRIDSEKSYYERYIGLGNPNSRFYTVPDSFLNPAYVEHIKNKPDSGVAKLYNKYMEINKFASESLDSNVKGNILPYIRKSTVESLSANGFNLRKSTHNALEKLKTYEWETYDLDSKGERVYKIPIKYDTALGGREASEQSYDLGKMLYMWGESVYTSDQMRKNEDTAKLFGLSLKQSKQIEVKNGVIQKEGIQLPKVGQETLDQYQEYLNKYFYGVKNEDSDFSMLGYSGHKVVKAGMTWLSTKALAGNVFSAFANITGGLANAVAIGVKGNQFKAADYGTLVQNTFDPKVRAIVALFDVDANVFDAEKYSSLSSSVIDKHLSWDKLFVLQKKGDWLLQNSTLMAMMKNYSLVDGNITKGVKEGEKSLFDLIQVDKNNKIGIEGLDLSTDVDMMKFLKFRSRVQKVNSEILGNTSEHDMFLASNTLLGQMALQFRRWLLPMATSRFGAFRYNANLEEYEVGRYRSLAGSLFNKQVLKLAKEFLTEQRSPRFDEIILEKYQKQQALNPAVTLSFEEFRALYISNIKSTLAELAILMLISGLLMGLKGDDDNDKNFAQKMLSKALTRTANELSFWFLPDSFMNIVQAPIPLITLVEDSLGLVTQSSSQVYGFITGDQEIMEDAKPGAKLAKLTIGFNAYYNFVDEIEKK